MDLKGFERCPTCGNAPTLTGWARKAFVIGRENNMSDADISFLIKYYALDNGYSNAQISYVLRENGISRNSSYIKDRYPLRKRLERRRERLRTQE